MPILAELLQEAAARHHHLCPRQVLGIRLGLLAGHLLELDVPQKDKRLFTIVETDGCGADGISVATGCWVGRRTMRIEDYGKVAATCVDTQTGRALRIAPQPKARDLAHVYAPEAPHRWQAYLEGYQRMPAELLFAWQEVTLVTPVEEFLSRPSRRTLCHVCGEEIMNERELISENRVLCRACAGLAYYRPASCYPSVSPGQVTP
jgi:formylmethanofuran dehydrogenase subunit E